MRVRAGWDGRRGGHALGWRELQALWREGGPGRLTAVGRLLPSTQSLSRPHTQTRGCSALVMEHWNWLGAQVTSLWVGESEGRPAALSPQLLSLPSPGLVLVLPAISLQEETVYF